jgi:hypothetical protein
MQQQTRKKMKTEIPIPDDLDIVAWRPEIDEPCWAAMSGQDDNGELVRYVNTLLSSQTTADILSEIQGLTLETVTAWPEDSPSWIQTGEVPASWMTFVSTKVLCENEEETPDDGETSSGWFGACALCNGEDCIQKCATWMTACHPAHMAQVLPHLMDRIMFNPLDVALHAHTGSHIRK